MLVETVLGHQYTFLFFVSLFVRPLTSATSYIYLVAQLQNYATMNNHVLL